jgi:glutamate-1-semialdehyde 2,1-aminomutase
MNKYSNSEKLLTRAEKSIPLGTQTFSKSKVQFPIGVSPLYITHAKGSKIWDADGNKFTDFINSLASITLGYCDEDINNAVKNQLEKGTIFSLPSELEIELSEKLIDLIPSAEMVRFGKNGSDATAGAIRVARAFTKKDRVAVCGYHGWQDWYIGSTQRSLGVPKATRDLTHSFTYNDFQSLENIFKNYPDEIACVIMEAMNIAEPKNDFLHKVKDICKKNNSLFILDETITGFRFHIGGAQSYFNVTPDISTFGKGISNGFPISAIVGRADVMKLFEEVFFSFTFGGELLSIIASLETIKKIQTHNVIQHLSNQGIKIINHLNKLISQLNCHDAFQVNGHPSWSFLTIKDSYGYSSFDIKTLFLQEMFALNILTIGTHNISYSHDNNDIELINKAYDYVIPKIYDIISKRNLEENLRCKKLQPLFKVR